MLRFQMTLTDLFKVMLRSSYSSTCNDVAASRSFLAIVNFLFKHVVRRLFHNTGTESCHHETYD